MSLRRAEQACPRVGGGSNLNSRRRRLLRFARNDIQSGITERLRVRPDPKRDRQPAPIAIRWKPDPAVQPAIHTTRGSYVFRSQGRIIHWMAAQGRRPWGWRHRIRWNSLTE